MLVHLAMAGDGLSHPSARVAIPVVVSAMPDQYRTSGRKLRNEISKLHANSKAECRRTPGTSPDSMSRRSESSIRFKSSRVYPSVVYSG